MPLVRDRCELDLEVHWQPSAIPQVSADSEAEQLPTLASRAHLRELLVIKHQPYIDIPVTARVANASRADQIGSRAECLMDRRTSDVQVVELGRREQAGAMLGLGHQSPPSRGMILSSSCWPMSGARRCSSCRVFLNR